jgi:hypothetical protein
LTTFPFVAERTSQLPAESILQENRDILRLQTFALPEQFNGSNSEELAESALANGNFFKKKWGFEGQGR